MYTSVLILCAAISPSIIQVAVAGCCPDGWITHKSRCYYVGYETKLTFSEAMVYCYNQAAQLVRFESYGEYSFLRNLLKKTQASSAWIGLSDRKHEGIWQWVGSNGHATFSDWGPGEPNNLRNNEDCVGFFAEEDYKWNDFPCTNKLKPVCEKSS
ncbi:perlucin-like protein [Mercenaria mercenaria]|uniref:perlucin-like protein n=1 Tax=Mercenaria mercenaria TaxID=6596 RepID=UPI00234EFB7F|nr:perlucin-like protein [Mercenaria mercenaria]XP_053390621.1 perlucin-like protein [Mercenaria mercenaria]